MERCVLLVDFLFAVLSRLFFLLTLCVEFCSFLLFFYFQSTSNMNATSQVTVPFLTSIQQAFEQTKGHECDVYFNARNSTIYIVVPNGQSVQSSIAYALAKNNPLLEELLQSCTVSLEVKQRSSFKPTKAFLRSDRAQLAVAVSSNQYVFEKPFTMPLFFM